MKANAKQKIYKCVGCGAHTQELHEVIPGHGRRDVCIRYFLQVPVCRDCHNTCHGQKTGKLNRINGGADSVDVRDVEKKLCKLMKLDYTITRTAVWNSEKVTLDDLAIAAHAFLKSQEVWYNKG